jgi:GAF domain-containing protein
MTATPSAPPPFESMLARLRDAIGAAADRDAAMRAVVLALSGAHPHYTWTGIYLLDGETLVLHNQVGAPTPHERIPVGRGICGLAAREARTVVVPDVTRDPRFLACSLSTRSEIVVPIRSGDRVFGEIDVDSDQPDAFDDADRRLLEAVAADLARLF